jgi:hypothetical protein
MPTKEAKASRRRLQFSLRSLFVAITLVALLLGLRTWQVQRHQRAVQSIRRLDGKLILGPEWVGAEPLRPLFFSPIASVDLSGTPATSEDLKPLAALSELQYLNLNRTQIASGGLAPLAGLTKLTVLLLADTRIDDGDLVHLHRLRNLARLDLGATGISDAGLRHLGSLPALAILYLNGTRATGAGLEPLCGLPKLGQLCLDERQITPEAVAWLVQMPALKRLLVHVPRGPGKRAWELLSPLKSLQAMGFQSSEGRGVWLASAAWNDTNAGVLEGICRHVALKPVQEAALLDALAETNPDAVWKKGFLWLPAFPRFPPPDRPTIPERDRIRSVEQFMQMVTQDVRKTVPNRYGGTWAVDVNFNRARLFAGSDAARSVVPALLKVVNAPRQTDADYWSYEKAMFLLVRIAGDDPRVVAALVKGFRSKDQRLLVGTLSSFDDEWMDREFGRIGPTISAVQAEVLVSSLLGLAKDPDPAVREAIADAIARIAPTHPRHVRSAVGVLLELLQDREMSVANRAAYTLEAISVASPEQVGVIVPKLLAMLAGESPIIVQRQTPAPPAPTTGLVALPALNALCLVAANNRQAARAAIPVLLRALRETQSLARSGATTASDVDGALARIIGNDPEQLQTVLPAILALLEDQDRQGRAVARAALAAVVAGVWEWEISAGGGR